MVRGAAGAGVMSNLLSALADLRARCTGTQRPQDDWIVVTALRLLGDGSVEFDSYGEPWPA
jgi:hypothetical protein